MIVAVGQTQPPLPIPAPPPAPIVSHRITVLRDWVSAVQRHIPGESDSALLSVVAWSRDDADAAWIDIQAIVTLLKNENARSFLVRPSGQRVPFRVRGTKDDYAAMRRLAEDITMRHASIDSFLKRAATLHTDVALEFQMDGDEVAPPASMTSPRRVVVQTDDGQQVGLHGGIVHWEFGRVLLDSVSDPSRDEFVRGWYRATIAHKLATEELDSAHFASALEIFPNDAVIRFQTGCLHDAFAHPAVQSVVDSAKLPPKIRLDVRSQSVELREAEAQFRRAIEIDPEFAEARLRRGRVLARQGKHHEAAAELRLALKAAREPLLEYYARLFLGAEEEALGRFAVARALYEQAATLYPHAQAPRMALSQLAHRSGNRAAARDALNTVLESSAVKGEDDDPWWTYQQAAGRQANEWIQATYRLLERER